MYKEYVSKKTNIKYNLMDYKNELFLHYNIEDGIFIPMAVKEDGKMFNLILDDKIKPYALFVGSTGTGKTNALHNVIINVNCHYTKEDIEIWLLDLKTTEFSNYSQYLLPNIKILGMDDSPEFIVSFFKKLIEKMEERKTLFKNIRVANISDYNSYSNVKMPRLLLIIDEFHKFVQALTDANMNEEFENMLSESRVLGLRCIFSDQDINGSGMNAFTEKARNQIRTRISWLNPIDKVIQSLELSTANIDRVTLKNRLDQFSSGEIIINDNNSISFAKVLYVETKNNLDLEYVSSRLPDNNDIIIIDKPRREKMNKNYILELEKKICDLNKENIYVYLGTNNTFEKYMYFSFGKRSRENLLISSDSEDYKMSLIISLITCLTRDNKNKVTLIATKKSDLFIRNKILFNSMKSLNIISIYQESNEICNYLATMNKMMNEIGNINEFIILLDIDNLFDIFDSTNILNNGGNIFDSISSESVQSKSVQLVNMLNFGSKNRMHFIVLTNCIKDMSYIRQIKIDMFNHKIFGKENKLSLLSSEIENSVRNKISSLSDDNLIYCDVFNYFSIFKPFKEEILER